MQTHIKCKIAHTTNALNSAFKIEPLELAKMLIRYENKGCKFWDLFPHPLILLKGYSKYAGTDLLKQKTISTDKC